MSDDQIRQIMIEQFGLRIQRHMTLYVQRRLLRRDRDSVPVIGGDARTGVSLRKVIALQSLERAAAANGALDA